MPVWIEMQMKACLVKFQRTSESLKDFIAVPVTF